MHSSLNTTSKKLNPKRPGPRRVLPGDFQKLTDDIRLLMNTKDEILELPIDLVGVSDRVADWLHQAGIPTRRLGQLSAMKSAFRWTLKGSGQAGGSLKRCVLFDSRDLASRTLVKSHQKEATCKLDVARLLRATVPASDSVACAGNPLRYGFLKELKTAIEAVGGVWARLADLPFPYQGIGCVNGELQDAGSEVGKPKGQPKRLDQIQKRYIAGLPSQIQAADLSELANVRPTAGLQSPGLPLLWRADQTDFAAWWRHRNHLDIQLRQSATHYRVDCRPVDSRFCPVLEIWRGNHIASVPLRAESILVRKDGLVFLRQPARNPAGFTAGWPDGPAGKLDPRLSA